MTPLSDDDATGSSAPPEIDDEAALARRAATGDQEAFDLLYERYFARTSWYFLTIFGRREAKAAITEVMTELFGSLGEPSDHSFAERAYRLAVATELRHAPPAKAKPSIHQPAKATSKATSAHSSRLQA